jgi:hypothetical protein
VKKRVTLIAIAVVAAAALVGMYATNAYATHTMTTNCAACHHSDSVLVVAATEITNSGTTAVYSVTATGAAYVAVFDGATKIDQVTGASGSISVDTGKTYVLQAVADTGSGTTGYGTTSISPVASGGTIIPTSTPDTAVPDTTCGTARSFHGDAAIRLEGTDAQGGWGMAYIYYSVDGAYAHLYRVPANRMSADVTVTIAAPRTGSAAHTVAFWSQDNYGNVETKTVETVTVTALTKMPMSIAVNHTSIYRHHPVTISGTVASAGMQVVLYMRTPGSRSMRVFRTLTSSSTHRWSFTCTPGTHGSYYFKAGFAGSSAWLPSMSTYKKVYVK